ncbi:acyl-CoA synthetase (AMP-forming)/AMP-acid ligase II [Sphingomonas jejuensis]|uniref:Acyl-CoA synthetase (AMP-forming)/AMP-acid ligase II n=1 Tax=Sphingomonas jejuensis TaxID=904715 RepID=A0ABX0XKP1_9SPHN|nr:class I adenylate-forming enzyme family protein [Sphingomonas jejuensis]NJC33914.1 acyl-CoA synthetase (AMP-forming)/AMP-acid ligase II [Sphingomonas jejuensis]
MPSPLDQKIDAILAALTAPGGQLAAGTVEKNGRSYPVIAVAPATLPQHFAYFCFQHGDATFLVDGEERLSFAETYAHARRLAGALVAGHGVRPGDRIGIAARNAPSWIVLYMAILMAGGTAVLLNGWWESAELAQAVADSGATLVFADEGRTRRFAAADPTEAQLVTVDVSLPIAEALAPLLAAGGDEHTPLPEVAADDPATILFTSGSTGRSRPAVSDHRAVVQATFGYLAHTLVGLQLLVSEGRAPTIQPATLLNVPLFHVTAMVPVFLQSFAMGRKLVLMPKWDAEEAMRLMEREKVTYFVGVPLMSFEILTHPNRANYDLSTVNDIAAGGAPRPAEHVRRLHEEMGGAKPLIGYGLTETNAIGCANMRENYLNKPDSTGRALKPIVEVAILDDDGRPLPTGSLGEICFRSIANFDRYIGDEAATAAAITPDGFFRTGDLGRMDEDGYVFIVDRKKDIIIRGGENISCVEVEAALYANEAVAEAAVFGLPDERFGEVPGAVVHLAEDADITGDALCHWLKGRIAAFKVPAHIWISPDPLPRLGTEKIDKVSLKAFFRARASEVQ